MSDPTAEGNAWGRVALLGALTLGASACVSFSLGTAAGGGVTRDGNATFGPRAGVRTQLENESVFLI